MLYNNAENPNPLFWKKIERAYKPGMLLVNQHPISVRILKGDDEELYRYKTFETDTIFLLVKVPRLETEQAMMAALQFDLLQGEKIVRFFCYLPPWNIFSIPDQRIGEE